jgi:alpha-mannosidase
MTVHIVPHSHDDAGWIKTADEYYTGGRINIGLWSQASVHMILDSVMDVLANDPKKRFTYAEMYFFHRWYNTQDQVMKDRVKQLIRDKRLEIVHGGWVSPDEACPNYEDFIINMYKGHNFLKNEFGYRPKIGWHYDQFGHSAANAALFTDFGLEAMFTARMSIDEQTYREKKRQLAFIWKPFVNNFGN